MARLSVAMIVGAAFAWLAYMRGGEQSDALWWLAAALWWGSLVPLAVAVL